MTGASTPETGRVTDRPAAARGRFYGWTVLFLFWLVLAVNLAFPMYGSGVISGYMVEDLGLSGSELGLSFGVFMAMMGLPAPLVALGIQRFGVRAALLVGSLVIAIGSLLLATVVESTAGVIVAFGLITASGIAIGGNIATQIGIGRWFVRKRALALSIMFSANGLGGLVAAPLLDWTIAYTGDWRSGWMLVGGLSVSIGIAAAMFVRERPEDLGQLPDGDGHDAKRTQRPSPKVHITQEDFSFAEARGTFAFWAIVAAIMTNLMGLTLVLSHGVPNLRHLGQAPAEAAMAVSIISGGTLVGKLVLGSLGDRIEPRLLWALSCLLIACGLFAAPFATSTIGIALYAAPFGVGFGAALVMQTAMLMNYFGMKVFGTLIGVALFAQTLVGAMTPIVGGWLFDSQGNYSAAFLIAATVNLFGAAILSVVRPPRKPRPVI